MVRLIKLPHYINKGLDKFENDKSVLAICGYVYPINISVDYSLNYFYYKTFSAWGYGIWRNRYKNFYYPPEKLISYMNNWRYVKGIYHMAPIKLLSILNAIKHHLPLYGDGVVSLENIKHNTYCVLPTVSKVKNLGHDGTGVHCGKIETDLYSSQKIDANNEFFFSEFAPLNDIKIGNEIQKHFKLSLLQKLKLFIYYIQFKLNILKNGE